MPLTELEAPPEQPGADVTTDMGPRLPKDRLGRRLLWAALASVLVNVVLWRVASQVVSSHVLAPPKPLTFRLVTLPPLKKVVPKKPVVKKPVVKRHIKKIVPKKVIPKKPIVKRPVLRKVVRRPVVHRVVRKPIERKPVVHKPVRRPPPPHNPPPRRPPPAHNNVMKAQGKTPARHTAPLGGHAQLGKPISQQNRGNGSSNNVPSHQPDRPTQPERPRQPEQPKTPEQPKQPERPRQPEQPTGPTQDALPSNQVKPDIPDELKTGDYKSHVRVKVDVAADGSFTASLVTSSGNQEIDQRVLSALNHWKWKPALDNGRPVRSTQRFRFDFQVQ